MSMPWSPVNFRIDCRVRSQRNDRPSIVLYYVYLITDRPELWKVSMSHNPGWLNLQAVSKTVSSPHSMVLLRWIVVTPPPPIRSCPVPLPTECKPSATEYKRRLNYIRQFKRTHCGTIILLLRHTQHISYKEFGPRIHKHSVIS